jgi:hypothetical protein
MRGKSKLQQVWARKTHFGFLAPNQIGCMALGLGNHLALKASTTPIIIASVIGSASIMG